MGMGSRAPASVRGSSPPSVMRAACAPISSRGSRMRFIGRLRRLASPSKVAVTGQPPTAPMTRRQPVPELPQSSAPAGSRKPPTPTPRTRHWPSATRSTSAPSARIALPVLSTSSPSSSPDMRVSPTVSAPKISARCEIDLSPGTRARPLRAPARRAVSGDLAAWSTDGLGLAHSKCGGSEDWLQTLILSGFLTIFVVKCRAQISHLFALVRTYLKKATTMSVRKRTWTNQDGSKGQAWVAEYTDHEGKRRLRTFETKQEADSFHVG